MVRNDPQRRRYIWEAALRDAAGELAAFCTPEGLGMSLATLTSADSIEATAFADSIQERLLLGRVHAISEVLAKSDSFATTSYRHEITYTTQSISGALNVPRLIRARAANDTRGLPVVRAALHAATPENLFVSEVLQFVNDVCRSWLGRPVGERAIAEKIITQLYEFEGREPWRELRRHARPSMIELIPVVQSRVLSGAVDRTNPVVELLRLVADPEIVPRSLEMAAEPLAMFIADDPRFEDRLFELLVLGWTMRALACTIDRHEIHVCRLKKIKGNVVMSGEINGKQVELYYQGSKRLPRGAWRWRRPDHTLRSLPDIVVAIEDQFIILDAKNRDVSSESEVAYKLLGYKDNLRFSPYYGVGILPLFQGESSSRFMSSGDDRILLSRVHLSKGMQVMGKLVQHLINRFG